MKKIIALLSVFLGLGFICSVAAGFIIDQEVENSTFCFLCGLEYFVRILPALSIGGFVISCSVSFGRNPQGSSERFSSAMFARYKTVMIISLVCTFILSFFTQAGILLISRAKLDMINRPKIINTYLDTAKLLYNTGWYERSLKYADAVLELDSNNTDALDLRSSAVTQIENDYSSSFRTRLYDSSNYPLDSNSDLQIDAKSLNTVYDYYKKASEAYENQDWFNAHYFAKTGADLASSKDPNLKSLIEMASSAWNKISEQRENVKTQEQSDFEKKYQGYLALSQNDDLKAYQIFFDLQETSHEFRNDPDVKFYFEIAKSRVEQKYFFIDETFELQTFESANDICFSYDYSDGSKDIVYFKGMSKSDSTGNLVQYLRDLTIITLDKNGEFTRKMNVPWAKLLTVSRDVISANDRRILKIDEDVQFLPFLLLNSVSRENTDIFVRPTYTYADSSTNNEPGWLIFPVSYEDFIMLEGRSVNPDTISISTLFELSANKKNYGYSQTVYTEILMNRIFYPFVILIMFIICASISWSTRIGIEQYFKAVWIFVLPFIFILSQIFYLIVIFISKLVNYAVISSFGGINSFITLIFIHLFSLIVASIYFIARKS